MAYDAELAQRIRTLLADRLVVTERQMFGDLVFLVDGHIAMGVDGETMLVNVGPDRQAEALGRGAQPWSMGRRTARGMVAVPAAGLVADEALAGWVDWGLSVVGR
jgi:TfoX N-terminal domain